MEKREGKRERERKKEGGKEKEEKKKKKKKRGKKRAEIKIQSFRPVLHRADEDNGIYRVTFCRCTEYFFALISTFYSPTTLFVRASDLNTVCVRRDEFFGGIFDKFCSRTKGHDSFRRKN